MTVVNRADLAALLRARRARVSPHGAGLPEIGRRRTPGLRRQEVAQLAGLSVDYYIRLEQGRGPNPSRQVMSALARVLMLTADEDFECQMLHIAGTGQRLITYCGASGSPTAEASTQKAAHPMPPHVSAHRRQ